MTKSQSFFFLSVSTFIFFFSSLCPSLDFSFLSSFVSYLPFLPWFIHFFGSFFSFLPSLDFSFLVSFPPFCSSILSFLIPFSPFPPWFLPPLLFKFRINKNKHKINYRVLGILWDVRVLTLDFWTFLLGFTDFV